MLREGTCLRSHSKELSELRLEPKCPWLQSCLTGASHLNSLQLPTGGGEKRDIILPSKPEPAQIQPHAPSGSLVVV